MIDKIKSYPWAIMPSKLRELASTEYTQADETVETSIEQFGSIVVLPLEGVLMQKAGWFGTSTDAFGELLDSVVANPQVKTIILDVDSPGGEVFGVSELADKIYAAREKKKIIAVANSLMASAAYWISSSAHEIVAAPSSITGSIGVIAMHEDWSKELENMGVKITIIIAGEHKADGSPYAPLTEPAAIEIKKRVDYYYEMFTESVGRNRGVTANQVKKTYGDGRVFNAKEAKEIGLIDRIDTLQGTINRELAKMAKSQKNKNLRASII